MNLKSLFSNLIDKSKCVKNKLQDEDLTLLAKYRFLNKKDKFKNTNKVLKPEQKELKCDFYKKKRHKPTFY